jgi:HK97 gp10 family phage protein
MIQMRLVMNRVPQVTASTVARAEEAAVATRELIAKKAEENAPVLTGELERSIDVEGDEVRVKSDHGLEVEFGTVFMAAEPFFRPAIRDGEKLLAAMVRDLIV